MKKIIAVLLALVMAIGLCACGNGGSDSEYAGKYECVSAVWPEMDDWEIGPDGEWIELKDNGKGTYYMGNTVDVKTDIEWTVNGDTFKMENDDLYMSYEGTLSDGTLVLNMEDIIYGNL